MKIDEVVKTDLNILTGTATIIFKSDGETYRKVLSLYNEDGTVNETNFELYNKICEKDCKDYEEGRSTKAKEESATYKKINGALKLAVGAIFLVMSRHNSMKLYDMGKTPEYEVIKPYYSIMPNTDPEELEEETAKTLGALALVDAIVAVGLLSAGTKTFVDGLDESEELKAKKKNR